MNCQEIQDAHFAAREHFLKKNQPLDLLNQNAFQSEIGFQLLLRMVMDPDDERPNARLFPNVEAVRKTLTDDMTGHFFAAHKDLRDRRAREQGIVIDDGA